MPPSFSLGPSSFPSPQMIPAPPHTQLRGHFPKPTLSPREVPTGPQILGKEPATAVVMLTLIPRGWCTTLTLHVDLRAYRLPSSPTETPLICWGLTVLCAPQIGTLKLDSPVGDDGLMEPCGQGPTMRSASLTDVAGPEIPPLLVALSLTLRHEGGHRDSGPQQVCKGAPARP